MSLRRILLWIGGVALALAVGVVVGDQIVMPALVHRHREVLVPDFRGQSIEDAQREAHGVGLSVAVGEEVFSGENPPGTVLDQFPAPMRPVRTGRPVRLVVSKGEALARVPDLSGMSLRQSELTLLREGLTVGRVARSYDMAGEMGVVSQRPHPGAEVERGTPIRLLVREGRERVHHYMPELRGRNLVRVREELTRAGFEVGTVTYRPSDDDFPGVVLDQWPPAGSRVPGGGSVDLVASSRS